LAVFRILTLVISNRYNFADFYATALKFHFVTNLSVLFQTMSMMSSITVRKRHSLATALCLALSVLSYHFLTQYRTDCSCIVCQYANLPKHIHHFGNLNVTCSIIVDYLRRVKSKLKTTLCKKKVSEKPTSKCINQYRKKS
jgi:hypothetical protein